MRYKCSECGDEFRYEVNCSQHNFEKKHEDFEILGSDAKIKIKS